MREPVDKAVVIFPSPNTDGHSENDRLMVTITDVRSHGGSGDGAGTGRPSGRKAGIQGSCFKQLYLAAVKIQVLEAQRGRLSSGRERVVEGLNALSNSAMIGEVCPLRTEGRLIGSSLPHPAPSNARKGKQPNHGGLTPPREVRRRTVTRRGGDGPAASINLATSMFQTGPLPKPS